MLERLNIRIPVNLSEKAIKTNEASMLSVYLFLKSLYSNGVIFLGSDRRKTIANQAGLTKKTLNKYILQLIRKRLAFELSGNLHLFSKKVLCEYFNIEYKYYRTYFYKYVSFKDLKDHLRALTVNDNLYSQYYFQNFKMKQSLNFADKTNTKILKQHRAGNAKTFNGLGNNVTVSQRGISKLFGNSMESPSSGQYWTRKLEKSGKLSTKKRAAIVIHRGCTQVFFNNLRSSIPEQPIIFYKGNIYQPQSNLIRISI